MDTIIQDPMKPACKRIKLSTSMEDNVVVPQKTKVISDDHKPMLKNVAFENLVKEKKLLLVLDLDHTLLHSLSINTLTPDDRDLILKETNDPKNASILFLVKLMDGNDFVTKLRPGLRRFMDEASKLYQLHVFTMGSRDYAMQILKLIDPENVYFGCKSSSTTRVFTRESCVRHKSLDLVIGKESGILIIDDNEMVWRDVDKENVLQIPEYNFFELGADDRILFKKIDESETEGWLAEYLDIIKLIHASFFNPEEEGDVLDRDVRVLKNKLLDGIVNEQRETS